MNKYKNRPDVLDSREFDPDDYKQPLAAKLIMIESSGPMSILVNHELMQVHFSVPFMGASRARDKPPIESVMDADEDEQFIPFGFEVVRDFDFIACRSSREIGMDIMREFNTALELVLKKPNAQ